MINKERLDKSSFNTDSRGKSWFWSARQNEQTELAKALKESILNKSCTLNKK